MSVPDTICLLDDDPSVLKALGRLFASEGLETEKFIDPALFIAYAESHPVRLAVVDVRMPGTNGIEVMMRLRSVSPETKVIIMTAESDPWNRTSALAGGASAFFLKPFDDAAFVEAVRAAIPPIS